MSQKPARILVVRFSSIGDIILTTPLLRVIQQGLPDAEVHYLTKDTYAPLLERNPRIARVWTLAAPHKVRQLRELAPALREQQYAWTLDLHQSLRSRFLRLLLRRPVLTYRKRAIRRFFYVHFKLDLLASQPPVRTRYFEAVRLWGLEDDGQPPEIWLTPEEKEWAREVVGRESTGAGRPLVAFALGAGKETKRWPAEHFANLGHSLRKDTGARFLLLGDGRDRAAADLVASELGDAALDFVGKTTLRQTASLLAVCDLVVSNDSGLMHMAEALGRKLVAIFGATTPQLGFAPTSANSIVLEAKDVPCRPCSHIGRDRCPRGHFRCMWEVKPEAVKKAVEGLLAR